LYLILLSKIHFLPLLLHVRRYGNTSNFAFSRAVTSAVAPQFWNSTLGTNGGGARCIAEGRGAACYFAATAYESLTNDNGVSGVFVINSLVDTHQLGSCFGLYCFYPGQTCTPDQLAAVQAYALELCDAVLAAQAPFGDRDGCVCLFIFCLCVCLCALVSGLILLVSHFDVTFFSSYHFVYIVHAFGRYALTTCRQHEHSCRWVDWYGIRQGGQSPAQTFAAWYAHGGGGDGAGRRLDAPWPSDTSCVANVSFAHGSC
jgi:hypothetical protein